MNYLKLIRYKNLLMIVLTIVFIQFFLIDSQFKSHTFSNFYLFLFIFSTISFTALGYVFNDIYDVKTDQINKPEKLIISESISISRAYLFALFLFLIGLSTGLILSFNIQKPFYILYLLVPLALVILYTIKLKQIALVGNISIALCAFWIFPLVFAFQKFDNSSTTFFEALNKTFDEIVILILLFYYGLFSFLITLIREIIKDIEDINGDYNMNMKTLPILLGVKRTRNITLIVSFIFLFLLGIAIKSLFEEEWYFTAGYVFVFTAIPMLYFIYTAWFAETKNDFKSLSKILKFIMFLGMLSMISFKFI